MTDFKMDIEVNVVCGVCGFVLVCCVTQDACTATIDIDVDPCPECTAAAEEDQ